MRAVVIAVVALLLLAPTQATTAELATELVMPAAARGPGAGGSVWRMDLFITNPGAETVTVRLVWLERDHDNSNGPSRTVTVPAGATAVLTDVLLERFGLSEAAGALRVLAPTPIAATSRIYNLLGETTFGQGFDALAEGRGVGTGKLATVAGLRQEADARSNLFAVGGARGAELEITLRQPFGRDYGTTSVLLPPWGAAYVPVTDIYGGVPGNLVADVAVTAGTAWIAGSRIDRASGDPLTMPAVTVTAAVPTFDGAASVGTYFGEWVNQLFGSSGAALFDLSVDTVTGTATLQMDLDGPVLGGTDPELDVLTGSFGPWGAELRGSSPTFGELWLAIGADGRVRGGSADVPTANVETVSFDGVLSGDALSLVFVVDYAGTLVANSSIFAVR